MIWRIALIKISYSRGHGKRRLRSAGRRVTGRELGSQEIGWRQWGKWTAEQ